MKKPKNSATSKSKSKPYKVIVSILVSEHATEKQAKAALKALKLNQVAGNRPGDALGVVIKHPVD